MPVIKSCCCWRSLRRGCYASASYTMVYFAVTIITMGHFIEVEHRYLSGQMTKPESESFLEPDKITPILYYGRGAENATFVEKLRRTAILWLTEKRSPSFVRRFQPKHPKENGVRYRKRDTEKGLGNGPMIGPHWYKRRLLTVSLNITLLACSTLGLVSCILLIVGVYKDIKFLLVPWIISMGLETLVEVINLVYLFYLQTLNFNPITAFLFTLDFFIIVLNVYTMLCVISQFQEYLAGRGTVAFDYTDRLAAVQYTATAQHTTTTSSAPSGRRRSAGRPIPSRCDPEEYSEVPTKIASVLSKPSRSNVKKHVQFPDEQTCIEEATETPQAIDDKPEARVISSLWMELESEAPAPER